MQGDKKERSGEPGTRIPYPVQLYLEITSDCNLRCKHCYLNAGREHVSQIEPEDLGRLMHEFREIGGRFLTFSGGEPTLHGRWKWGIDEARIAGLECTFLTNALRLSFQDMKFLAGSGVHVHVSLDGACRETHDAIRGSGTFVKTMNNLSRMVELGMGPHIALCFTPLSGNYRELPSLVSMARESGIGGVYVSLLENRGRAASRYGEYGLNTGDKVRLLYELLSLRERYPEIRIQCSNLGFFLERISGTDLVYDDLEGTIRVSPQGEVFLSAYLEAEPFHLGSCRGGHLRDLWFSPKVQKAFHEAGRRKKDLTECRKCTIRRWCQCGSATLAWAENGMVLSVDSYCAAKKRLARELFLRKQ